jgi:hypothetical protein
MECGFTIHRGVLVQWDEDRDQRVLDFIDAMPISLVDHLQVVQEHEGSIDFIWEGVVPKGYREGDFVDSASDADVWVVNSSFALPSIERED